MQKIKELYERYKEIIKYLIFGVLTTVVNFISFFIFQKVGIELLINNVLSWIIAVAFAYITNKIFVFNSKTVGTKEFIKEVLYFFSCRVFTLLIEEAMLFILVKKLGMNEYLIKIIAQAVTIITNYILSKVVIFRKKEKINEKNINNSTSI